MSTEKSKFYTCPTFSLYVTPLLYTLGAYENDQRSAMAKTKRTVLKSDKRPKEFFSETDIDRFIEEAGGFASSHTYDCSSGKLEVLGRKALLKWQLERIADSLFFDSSINPDKENNINREPSIPGFDDYPQREKKNDAIFDTFIDQLCYVWADTFQKVEIKTSYNLNKDSDGGEAGGPFVVFAAACWNHFIQFGAETKTRNAIRDAIKKRLKNQQSARDWHEERTRYILKQGYSTAPKK